MMMKTETFIDILKAEGVEDLDVSEVMLPPGESWDLEDPRIAPAQGTFHKMKRYYGPVKREFSVTLTENK